MNIRRILASLLAAMLLGAMLLGTMFLTAAVAEEDFGFDFDEGGYTGEWLEIPALGLELCLPDGWSETEAAEGDAFAAVKDDGTASLAIRALADQVEDIVDWGDANLPKGGYAIDTTGFYDTLVAEADDRVTIYRLNDSNQLLAYDFSRSGVDALSRDFALEIVDSVSEAWIDEGEALASEDADDLLAQFLDEEGFGD